MTETVQYDIPTFINQISTTTLTKVVESTVEMTKTKFKHHTIKTLVKITADQVSTTVVTVEPKIHTHEVITNVVTSILTPSTVFLQEGDARLFTTGAAAVAAQNPW